MFDFRPLHSFKSTVLRVLFQLESPNSEHRNSSYVQNNPDYSMFKAGTRIWLAHGPTLSTFLGHLGSEFGDAYSLSWFSLKSVLRSNLNHSNRIRNEQVMAKIRKLVETGKTEQGVPVHHCSSTGTLLLLVGCTGTILFMYRYTFRKLPKFCYFPHF